MVLFLSAIFTQKRFLLYVSLNTYFISIILTQKMQNSMFTGYYISVSHPPIQVVIIHFFLGLTSYLKYFRPSTALIPYGHNQIPIVRYCLFEVWACKVLFFNRPPPIRLWRVELQHPKGDRNRVCYKDIFLYP